MGLPGLGCMHKTISYIGQDFVCMFFCCCLFVCLFVCLYRLLLGENICQMLELAKSPHLSNLHGLLETRQYKVKNYWF